ncbi:MFS transporter [Georgenia sp. H159]|uniref:MFS transporter n=1 Tax=Georgenia sp. H159 TaxID=3076115 RepID=UPI002D787F1F|nr:MFS transporter [Georgenia sp. H159]
MSTPVTAPWRYAIGMFGTSIPINMIKGSMILFYVDILGLDVRAYGIVMAVYAVIDAVDNPLLGHLSDRTRTRYGRRRPWLLVGGPLLAVGLVGFFWVPDTLDGVTLVVWFAVFAILCEACDSLLNANYGALLPELFPGERRRAAANSLRQGFQLVALVVSLALTPLLTTQVFGTEESTEGFRTTAVIYAVVATVAIVVMALGARENPDHASSTRSRFLPTLATILRNRLFWQIGLASACYLSAMALVLTGVQLYVRYSLGLPVAYALYLQAAVIVVSAGGLAVWTRVVARRGAAWTWRLAFLVLALSFVPLFLATTLWTALPAGLLLGVGWSGMLATNDLVIARVLDHDAATHGEHREGLFLSAFGVLGRLNGALNGLALASLGLFFGYYSGDDPGDDPALAFRVYVCAYPFVVALAGAVLARFIRVPDDTPHDLPEIRPASGDLTSGPAPGTGTSAGPVERGRP